jgi:hypothetical protein
MPKLNGVLFVLYAHNGDWTVSSQTSMSADEPIHLPLFSSNTTGTHFVFIVFACGFAAVAPCL